MEWDENHTDRKANEHFRRKLLNYSEKKKKMYDKRPLMNVNTDKKIIYGLDLQNSQMRNVS